jgi:hypothetical protein
VCHYNLNLAIWPIKLDLQTILTPIAHSARTPGQGFSGPLILWRFRTDLPDRQDNSGLGRGADLT